MKGKETDWTHIEEILKRSKAGNIPPPKRGFLGLIHRCPRCDHRVNNRYFKRVWNIGGKFAIFYRIFKCPVCHWQYVLVLSYRNSLDWIYRSILQ
jgi:ssDNA-binding Zn-finger/Zn-ribbon topoisomerase 1